MEVEAAKLIGAGLATIGVAGPGIGLGTVFGAIALFALVIAFLILF